MKKLFLIILLLTYGAPTHTVPSGDMRIQGLICCGLILAAGGTYQLIKRSNTKLHSVTDTLQGLILLASGFLTILLSRQIVHETDNCFS